MLAETAFSHWPAFVVVLLHPPDMQASGNRCLPVCSVVIITMLSTVLVTGHSLET